MNTRFTLRAKDWLDSGERKKQFNEEHFAESAPRYDLATRGLSLCQDSYWKRQLIRGLPNLNSHAHCVDIACGTGDITFLLANRYPDADITGLDLTREMIEIAESRNTRRNIQFSVGDMSRLRLEDESIDLITGGYAIRNAPDLRQALGEFHRVLKNGGHAAFLDFSKPKSSFGKRLQYLLLKFWGGFWGLLLHGNPEIHGYISESLKQFPDLRELEKLFVESGFEIRKSRPFLSGMTMIWFLKKQTTPTGLKNEINCKFI